MAIIGLHSIFTPSHPQCRISILEARWVAWSCERLSVIRSACSKLIIRGRCIGFPSHSRTFNSVKIPRPEGRRTHSGFSELGRKMMYGQVHF
ncbi:hypothetical protein EUGRSUZ_K00233 [Eucalyptus grandis]|uniref:Uncharacterized protein n=2 Tax=Eucalyptus grandis TaxID=71139 RepID=A0ACC3IR57_EUCGR|nr:hypothetical protein EUGRSUZ_K00233 [Eucalyptus grandis]